MNAMTLIKMQLELECIGVDSDNGLVRIPGPDPDDIARVYAFYSEDQYWVFFRHDLPPSIQKQLRELPAEKVFRDHQGIKMILATAGAGVTVGHYQSYLFPDGLNPHQFSDVVEQVQDGRREYAIIQGGKVVSVCRSVRENDRAGECYVFTEPAYRGRSYARQTTAAWAYHLQQSGKIPFYSHTHDNHASKGVASSLGLIPCFALVNYD